MQAALWTCDGEMTLSDRATGDWGFSVVGAATGAMSYQVPTLSMATLMRQHDIDRIDLVKMDIEGAEKQVFEQSHNWIGKVDCIAVELHERIQSGCVEAMRAATAGFGQSTVRGEKIILLPSTTDGDTRSRLTSNGKPTTLISNTPPVSDRASTRDRASIDHKTDVDRLPVVRGQCVAPG